MDKMMFMTKINNIDEIDQMMNCNFHGYKMIAFTYVNMAITSIWFFFTIT